VPRLGSRAVKSNKPANSFPPRPAVSGRPMRVVRLAELERSEQFAPRHNRRHVPPVAGQEFFRSLVKHLAEGLGRALGCFVAECLPNLRARVAWRFFRTTTSARDFEYALPGTPLHEGR